MGAVTADGKPNGWAPCPEGHRSDARAGEHQDDIAGMKMDGLAAKSWLPAFAGTTIEFF
jgi:hypothetical protein